MLIQPGEKTDHISFPSDVHAYKLCFCFSNLPKISEGDDEIKLVWPYLQCKSLCGILPYIKGLRREEGMQLRKIYASRDRKMLVVAKN